MTHQANIYRTLQSLYHKLIHKKREYNKGNISSSEMKDFYNLVRKEIWRIENEYNLTPNVWLQLVLFKRVLNTIEFLNEEVPVRNILDMEVEL